MRFSSYGAAFVCYFVLLTYIRIKFDRNFGERKELQKLVKTIRNGILGAETAM